MHLTILTYRRKNIADCPIFHSEQHNIVPPLGRPKTWNFEKLIKYVSKRETLKKIILSRCN